MIVGGRHFYTKAFNALRKYKVIGLPSGETDNTKLDADLTATRTNCRTEIQKIVNATKWMINNNVASTYLNSTHTIAVNNISMPDNIENRYIIEHSKHFLKMLSHKTVKA